MSKESTERPMRVNPKEMFGLSKQEQLFDRVSHARLMAFIDDTGTTVHHIEETANSYGSFLFVTLSRPGQDRRIWVRFYGLGFHEGRERWITDEWFFYLSDERFVDAAQKLSTVEAKRITQERRDTIRLYPQKPQTRRGQLYEMLADLTDDDGAWAEMQDLGDLGWWLLGEDE